MSTRVVRLPAWLLVVAFVVVPLFEIYVLIRVGQVIGAWWTIALLIADSLIGGWLVKREGRRAWRALTTALESGRMPASELADGALILVGGTLMLTPGFVTDALGIVLILPFTRPVARRVLGRFLAARMAHMSAPMTGARRPGATAYPGEAVIPGQVVDD